MDITNTIDFVALLGAVLYTVLGFFDKKRQEPTTVFDLTYAMATIGAIYGAVQVVDKAGLELTVLGIVGAFWIGFSFSAGLSKINTKIPIELPVQLGAVPASINPQELADLQKKVAEQEDIIKKLQQPKT